MFDSNCLFYNSRDPYSQFRQITKGCTRLSLYRVFETTMEVSYDVGKTADTRFDFVFVVLNFGKKSHNLLLWHFNSDIGLHYYVKQVASYVAMLFCMAKTRLCYFYYYY